MNFDIKIGVVNTLKITTQSEYGLYLSCENEDEVLLPNRFVTDDMKIGHEIDVFVYCDSEDRIVATTQTPKIKLNEFDFLTVVSVVKDGYFLDWGLDKDIYMPIRLSREGYKVGDKVFSYISTNMSKTNLIAINKYEKFLSTNIDVRKNQKVKVFITKKTPLGFSCIVNDIYNGIIYHSDIFKPIKPSQRFDAYIKKIRSDSKLDISINPIGNTRFDVNAEKILEILSKNSNNMPYNYKSDADDIKREFEMSKKIFKKSLTILLDKNLISLDENGIRLCH